MTQKITPGRYRGLKTASLAHADIFGIVAFDQRGSFRQMMPKGTSHEKLVQVKVEIIEALSRQASAILTDPIYGLYPAMRMSGQSGLIMALEESGYSGDSTYRNVEFLDGWTPEKIRKMGANAVKLLVYYNPQNRELAAELDELIATTVAECHAWDLPVFLEPMSYSKDASVPKDSAAFAEQRPEIVIETVRRLCKTGADVLKLEFPIDIKYNEDQALWRTSCEELSATSSVPWVLLSAGVDYDRFVPQVVTACESGASGFLAGRAIWKEGAPMPADERKRFLDGVATDRLTELINIAGQKSRPWTEFYSPMESSQDWYKHYGSATSRTEGR